MSQTIVKIVFEFIGIIGKPKAVDNHLKSSSLDEYKTAFRLIESDPLNPVRKVGSIGVTGVVLGHF